MTPSSSPSEAQPPDAFAAVFGPTHGGSHWMSMNGEDVRWQWEFPGLEEANQSLGAFLALLDTCADDDRVLIFNTTAKRDELTGSVSISSVELATIRWSGAKRLLAYVHDGAAGGMSVAEVRAKFDGHDPNVWLRFEDDQSGCYWDGYQHLTNSQGANALAVTIGY